MLRLSRGLWQKFAVPINTGKLISTSSTCFVKEIKVNENDKEIVIEGVRIESDRAKYLVKIPESAVSDHKCNSCPLCRLNLKRLAYSDVLILQQFINSDGSIMFQHETGLCYGSYRKVKRLVMQAQSAKLLPRPKDFKVNGPWDELNKYYEFPKRNRDRPISIIKKEFWR